MGTTIKLKRSSIPGARPTALHDGELAINTHDGLIFYKNTDGDILKLGSDVSELKTINGESIRGIGDISIPSFEDLSEKADIIHTHNAIDIIEDAEHVFITAEQRIKIEQAASIIDELSEQITILDGKTAVPNTDEKVKLTSTGESKYLSEHLDGTTIVNYEGKLAVISLKGLEVGVGELNMLAGVSSNIQEQLDNLGTIGNFTSAVDTVEDLAALGGTSNDIAIVLTDSLHENLTSLYIYDGTTWKYMGPFKGGESRDFLNNPLNINDETFGILPKQRYEHQSAGETMILDPQEVFTSTNVEGALVELYETVNNIRTRISTALGSPLSPTDTIGVMINKLSDVKLGLIEAIVSKGVNAYTFNTFTELSDKIRNIPRIIVEGDRKSTEPQQFINGSVIIIPLVGDMRPREICTSLIEYIEGERNKKLYTNNFASELGYYGVDVEVDKGLRIKTVFKYELQYTEMVDGMYKHVSTIDGDMPIELTF